MIDASGNALLDLSQLTRNQKGVMGDLFGQRLVKQIVPDGEKLARIPGVGETGIDDLYRVSHADVDYVVVEYKFVGAESKTGASALGKTADGLQGSTRWTTGSGRLERAVGGDAALDVRSAINSGRVETWVITTRPDGSTELQVLDALGKAKQIDTSKIVLPQANLTGVHP
jgi:filamentous hemagglutinin